MGLLLSTRFGSERAAHRDQHLFVLNGIVKSEETVDLSDAGEPPTQGRWGRLDRVMGDKRGDGFRRSRQGTSIGSSAPVLKNREIGPIASKGVLRIRTIEALNSRTPVGYTSILLRGASCVHNSCCQGINKSPKVNIKSLWVTLLWKSMITGMQIRSARTALRWTTQDLADRAGVSARTMKRFESVNDVPPSRSSTLADVKAALESAGIEFIGTPSDRPGIRFALPPKSSK